MSGTGSEDANSQAVTSTLSETEPNLRRTGGTDHETVLSLTVIWARAEPELVGQVAVVGASC